MSYGVIGNTSDFGSEELRFESLWDNNIAWLRGKELSLIRMVKWVQFPYSVQYRVVGQLVGRLIWDEGIVQVRVLSTLQKINGIE